VCIQPGSSDFNIDGVDDFDAELELLVDPLKSRPTSPNDDESSSPQFKQIQSKIIILTIFYMLNYYTTRLLFVASVLEPAMCGLCQDPSSRGGLYVI